MNCYYCQKRLTIDDYGRVDQLTLCCDPRQNFCLTCLFNRKPHANAADFLDTWSRNQESIACIRCKHKCSPEPMILKRQRFKGLLQPVMHSPNPNFGGSRFDMDVRRNNPVGESAVRETGYSSYRAPPINEAYYHTPAPRQMAPGRDRLADFYDRPSYQANDLYTRSARVGSEPYPRQSYPRSGNGYFTQPAVVEPGMLASSSATRPHRSEVPMSASSYQPPRLPFPDRVEPFNPRSTKMEMDEELVNEFNRINVAEAEQSSLQRNASENYTKFMSQNNIYPSTAFQQMERPALPSYVHPATQFQPRPSSTLTNARMTNSVLYTETQKKARDSSPQPVEEERTVPIARRSVSPIRQSSEIRRPSQIRQPLEQSQSKSQFTNDDYFKRRAVEQQKNMRNVQASGKFGYFKHAATTFERPVSADFVPRR